MRKNMHVRSDDFMVVTMKNAIFWDVTLYGSCKNRWFRGMYLLHHECDNNWRARNNTSSNWQPKHAEKKHYMRKEALELDARGKVEERELLSRWLG
jgi:hypothetical protein